MSAGYGGELLWIREMGLGYKWAILGRRQKKSGLNLFSSGIFQNEKMYKKSERMKIILNLNNALNQNGGFVSVH